MYILKLVLAAFVIHVISTVRDAPAECTGHMIVRLGWLLWSWLPVLGWMALILSLSGQSDVPIRTNPQTGETIRATFAMAKMAHVVEYTVLALLLLRALMTQAGGLKLNLAPAIILTVLVAGVFGGLDEFRQSLVPNREPRLTDVALDTASALAACLAVAGWFRVRRPRLLPLPAPERGLGGKVTSDKAQQ